MEPGADGQPPFADLSEIQPGTYLEAVGETWAENEMLAGALRPATATHAGDTGDQIESGSDWAALLLFPLTAVFIAVAMLMAEGVSSRNWVRMIDRVMIGILLTAIFSFLSFIPAAVMMVIGSYVMSMDASADWTTVQDMPAVTFVLYAACRSGAWAFIGAGLGLGMNLARSTKSQLRNSVIGGALGGALGGVSSSTPSIGSSKSRRRSRVRSCRGSSVSSPSGCASAFSSRSSISSRGKRGSGFAPAHSPGNHSFSTRHRPLSEARHRPTSISSRTRPSIPTTCPFIVSEAATRSRIWGPVRGPKSVGKRSEDNGSTPATR